MKKILFISLFLLLPFSAFCQRDHSSRHDHRHERIVHKDFREFRHFHYSRRALVIHRNIRNFVRMHNNFRLNYHFDFLSLKNFDTCITIVNYPNYFYAPENRIIFPERACVYFEPPFFNSINVEMINPNDILVFPDNTWCYLKDYYIAIQNKF